MTWKDIEYSVRKRFDNQIQKWSVHNKTRITIDVDPADLVSICRFLFDELHARFIIATGLDTPRGGVEIFYHFDFFQMPQVMSVRVFVKKPQLEIDSIAAVIKAAEWIEREMAELLGIRFKDHPNPAHLLLPEDWPDNNYPLRRDQ